MLKAIAERYERKEFLIGDPSWFMHQIEGDTNKELLAFIASALSYGNRKQFMPKIQLILDDINTFASTLPHPHSAVAEWLIRGRYNTLIPPSKESFYRLYTYKTFHDFLTSLALMVSEYGSMKSFLQATMQTKDAIEAITLITKWFREHGSTGVVPKDTQSSCKRVCMFLRWMVRTESPVDLGIWSDIIDRRTLIIPMDTHVVQEALRLNLIQSASTSMSNALKLSRRLAETFPEDPVKGDFALFGYGIDHAQE